eukprot:4774390-Prymnesium_polylepis.1
MEPLEMERGEPLRVGEREEHGHRAQARGWGMSSASPRGDGHEVVGGEGARVALGRSEEHGLQHGLLHDFGGGVAVDAGVHGLERSVGGVGAAGRSQGRGRWRRGLFGDGGERRVAHGADDGATLAQHLHVLRGRSSSSADPLAPRGPRGGAFGPVTQGFDEIAGERAKPRRGRWRRGRRRRVEWREGDRRGGGAAPRPLPRTDWPS